MQVHVVQVAWEDQAAALQAIRKVVFIEEQGVPKEIEWDGEDDLCEHFLAINEAGIHIGCARLMPSGQIGRMAVLEAHRGNNHGLALLNAAIDAAQQKGLTDVHLHAQAEAIGFYRKRGFLSVGPRFLEAGIEHQEMTLQLPLPFTPSAVPARPVIIPEQPPAKQAEADLQLIAGESRLCATLDTLVRSGTRQLEIFSHTLDPVLFDRQEFVDLVSALARNHRQAEIRILVTSTKLIVQRGCHLLDLARRIDSKIKIRSISDIEEPKTWVTADRDGYWVMPEADVYQGVSNVWDPVVTNRLRQRFTELWERSIDDPELRVLQL